MSITWHGKDNEIVWEQEINRYYFVSDEVVKIKYEFGWSETIRVGTRLKITKSEAHKFFKHGYILFQTTSWDDKKNKYGRVTIQLHNGSIMRDTETRVLKQYSCKPDDVLPPKRKKK